MQVLHPQVGIVDACRLSYGRNVTPEQALLWLDCTARLAAGAQPADCGASALSGGEVWRLETADGPVVVKRKFESGIKGWLVRAGLRQSQLHRSFRLGLKALALGLSTPEPLLYAERRLGEGVETIVVNRFEQGLRPWTLLQAPVASRMLESLARQLAQWHAAGLRHRDLKGPNLLYQPATDTSVLLDLAGVQQTHSHLDRDRRAFDLGRLRSGAIGAGMTPSQWQCFFNAYVQQSAVLGCSVDDNGDLPAAIERFVRRKLQRYAKLDKPVF